MLKLDQRGIVAQALILILLILGAVVGVYLVQNRTNLFPKAGGSAPLGPETSFSLLGPNDCPGFFVCTMQYIFPPDKGEEFEVKLFARSDIEEANLFTAKMDFPKDLVEVKEIKTKDSFIKNWVEEYYDNSTGKISLSGGVPNPGYKTQLGQPSSLVAVIVFEAKALGKGALSLTDDSAIYSNLNNINILTIKRNYGISIEMDPQPTPVASPSSCSENLAFKKPVTSSGYWEDGKPERAVDGDLGTAWRTNRSTGAWLTVDLANNTNNVLNIGRVKLIWLWDDRFGSQATSKIEVSTDGKNWTDVATTTLTKATNEREMQTLDFPSVSARYVRFYGEQWNGGWADMQTFEVYSAGCQQSPSPTPTLIPKPKDKGDGNKDGKINLIDMSVLHTDWNIDKDIKKTIREGIDMNNDGLINTADFAALRQLLQDLKVIKVK
ncbi:discoidin domain-containing protein [Candidatus Daviesbacteria bacterium]|nr:discoidin domain-containing protein [Candidatus Daviesbacteria bacterium]